MDSNIIQLKSFNFAIRIIKLAKHLKGKKEFELSSQIIRSGTSIGANIEEAIGAISKKDFLYKLSISYKESRETLYWIRLLNASEIIESKLAESFMFDCEELIKIMGKIISSTKKTIIKNKLPSPIKLKIEN